MFNIIYEGNGGGQRVGNFVPFTDNGTIAKSAIFDNGGPAYLNKTYGSAGTSLKKFTFSCWFKIGADTIAGTGAYFPTLFNVGGESGKYFSMFIQSQYQNIQLYSYNTTYDLRKITNRTFEDTSKWYHIVCAIDTTESTGSDRVKLYIDGDRITSFSTSVDPSQDYDLSVGAAEPYYVGFMNSGDTWDGYMAEVNYVDGTALTPSTFGLTDTSTGRWIPKTLTGITYGSNGFRMQFANSAGQTIGDDTSGNGNDFTVNNMDASDITTDSPTQNHMTFDPLRSSDWTFTEGNLQCAGTPSSGAGRHSLSNMIMPKSGKYYFEMTVDVNNDSPRYFGLAKADASITEGTASNVDPRIVIIRNGGTNDGHFYYDGTISSANGFSTTNGTVINFALDATNEKLYVGKDGNYYDFEGSSGNPANGTGATFSNIYKTVDWRAINMSFSTGSGGTSHKVTWNFGGKTFAYTAPTGFVALQQDNLPETGKGIPDFVWIKDRDNSYNHELYDTTRGPLNRFTAETDVEAQIDDGLQKFLKGGCQIEDRPGLNTNGSNYVSWNWLANGGTTSANTDGSGATTASVIQANQTAGFSVVTYTGTGSATKIAHGLSSAPEWIMIKNRTASGQAWHVYHKSIGATHALFLGGTDAKSDSTEFFNDVEPTSSVFTVNSSGGVNQSTKTMLAYCWHGVPGYSKFGSYVGNGNANGPFIYTGFKPSWFMSKRTDSTSDWIMWDNKRSDINPCTERLVASSTGAEGSASLDFLSNGIKIRNSDSSRNASSGNYIYMAFAEHPFIGTSSINPVTAR